MSVCDNPPLTGRLKHYVGNIILYFDSLTVKQMCHYLPVWGIHLASGCSRHGVHHFLRYWILLFTQLIENSQLTRIDSAEETSCGSGEFTSCRPKPDWFGTRIRNMNRRNWPLVTSGSPTAAAGSRCQGLTNMTGHLAVKDWPLDCSSSSH